MIFFKSILLGLSIGLVSIQTFANQTEIQATGPEGALYGTMTSAQTPKAPIALIVPGSGPTDRDGNSPLGLTTNTYKRLADDLATQGISTVRIDKRGMYSSNAATQNPNAVTMNDYAEDVQTWMTTLRQQTGTNCVWLVGHSEGGLVSLLAAQHSPDVCGLVLVATAGRPLGALIRMQLEANPDNAPIIGEAKSILGRLENGEHVDAAQIDPTLLPLFHPEVQDFLMSGLMLDPARLIANIDKPILILQGLRDIQVNTQDAILLLAQANPGTTLTLLDNTNHILKTVDSDDRNANILSYLSPSLPLASGVVDAIVSFIRKNE